MRRRLWWRIFDGWGLAMIATGFAVVAVERLGDPTLTGWLIIVGEVALAMFVGYLCGLEYVEEKHLRREIAWVGAAPLIGPLCMMWWPARKDGFEPHGADVVATPDKTDP